MRISVLSFLLVCAAVVLGACSSEGLLTKKSPDEFSVTRRAPLAMPPPEMTALPVPSPGAPRPQEQSVESKARRALTGRESVPASVTEGESALIGKAGAEAVDPRIRRRVDAESTEDVDESTPVVEKLFGWTGTGGDEGGKPLDPKEEAERLKKKGVPVIEKPTKPEESESE